MSQEEKLDAATTGQRAEEVEAPDEITRHMRLMYHARECALVAAFLEKYGEEALEVARKANYEAGMAAGQEALAKRKPLVRDLKTAAELYAEWSRGMPPTEQTDTRIAFRSGGPCGYWPIWKGTGLSLVQGCTYNGAWSEGFFHAINPSIRKKRESWRPGGDRECVEVYEVDEGSA